MTDISLTSGSSRKFKFAVVDSYGVLIPLAAINDIVWVVFSGSDEIITKSLEGGTILLLDEQTSTFYISLYHDDTAPDSLVGDTDFTKEYTHEMRFYFSDGTQDVPDMFKGKFTVKPTKTWGET
jgi:hypothetical protein